MKRRLRRWFSARSVLGTVLLLVLVGEPTVAPSNGMLSPLGLLALLALYFLLYHLFEALIVRGQLLTYQVMLWTFALYAVFITGFWNREIADFVLKPQDVFITILLRIQPSLFVAFAFYLLNRLTPRQAGRAVPLRQSVVGLAILFGLFSLSGHWGAPGILFTLRTAPALSLLFLVLALVAVGVASRRHGKATVFQSRAYLVYLGICLFIGLVPSLLALVALLLLMSAGGLFLLAFPQYRNHAL